ncbi:MAG: hypothetical protein ACRDSL_14695 [Pseudonocardiaceae bacterium]
MTIGEDPFLVVGQRGTERVHQTVASAVAAAAVAEYLRGGPHPATRVEWSLRDDVPHLHQVLLFTTTADDATIHATRLVPGKPVSEHPETCCGTRLDWVTGVPVCQPEMRPPCAGCLTSLSEVGGS